MSFHPKIILHNVSFSLINKPIITDLSCSFALKKYGVVGRNGIGESYFTQADRPGENPPANGSLQIEGKIAYFSQTTFSQPSVKVADVLAITDQLAALKRIANGSVDQQDFDLVGDDWNLQETVQRELTAFGLGHVSLDRSTNSISGGEYTLLLLAKTFMSAADFLILDEPTNNLDTNARIKLLPSHCRMAAWTDSGFSQPGNY